MTVATYPATTYPRAAAGTPRSHHCLQDGRYYEREVDCPCWTNIPEPRRSEYRGQLTAWMADFVRRNPEYAI